MNKGGWFVAMAAWAFVVAAPAQAGWKLVDHAKEVAVAGGAMKITPGRDWNRAPGKPIKEGERWTLDGLNLNELYFVGGLAPGGTLFPNIDKKRNPLPAFASSMQLTDIPDFYESSTRVALKTSLFEIGKIEPTNFAGHPGIRFTFQYALQDSPVMHKGVAEATLANGKLDMITYIAPTVYYFDRDLPEIEAIFASAKL
jgi:hypothetical protein